LLQFQSLHPLSARSYRTEPMAKSCKSITSQILHRFSNTFIAGMSNLHQSRKALRSIAHRNKISWLVSQILECMDCRQPFFGTTRLPCSNAQCCYQIGRDCELLAAWFVLRQVLEGTTCVLPGFVVLREGSVDKSWDDISQPKNHWFRVVSVTREMGQKLHRKYMGRAFVEL
jgi:hypothetical protein